MEWQRGRGCYVVVYADDEEQGGVAAVDTLVGAILEEGTLILRALRKGY
jgi:hypothetical protein